MVGGIIGSWEAISAIKKYIITNGDNIIVN